MTPSRFKELRAEASKRPNSHCAKLINECLDTIDELRKRKAKRTGFTPPTLEECRERARTIGLSQPQADLFFHHHEARGWRLRSGPMVKWESAMATWKINAAKFDAPINGSVHGNPPKSIGERFGVS